MSNALLLVPPFLKHATGPLLGPAMLAGAAAQAGHHVEVVDLNARWLAESLRPLRPWRPSPFVGDHDRDDELIRLSHRRFEETTAGHGAPVVSVHSDLLALRIGHRDVLAVGERIAAAERGWLSAQLRAARSPDLVGVSVLYAGQVLWAIAVTRVAKSLWPGVPVVWGGAHVTALAEEIARDPRYGAVADAFVAGYAESTFVALLDAVQAGAAWPNECFRAGDGAWTRARGDDGHVTPRFHDVHVPKGAPLTLPTQLSRGCSYGKCRYCTYPTIEGSYTRLATTSAQAVIEEAVRHGARVSFKDSLLTAPLLRKAAEMVRGRVLWSACTKLAPGLNPEMLRSLAAGGCHTLEIGLETLVEGAQELVDKRQSRPLFVSTLDAAAEAGIALVVNYMTGFPGVDETDEALGLADVASLLAARGGRLVACVEHNRFELERLAPLASDPPRGLSVVDEWPWSTVLAWTYQTPAPRRSLAVVS
jgi:hypothetical protein